MSVFGLVFKLPDVAITEVDASASLVCFRCLVGGFFDVPIDFCFH